RRNRRDGVRVAARSSNGAVLADPRGRRARRERVAINPAHGRIRSRSVPSASARETSNYAAAQPNLRAGATRCQLVAYMRERARQGSSMDGQGIFAVEAADESEARDIGNQVLRQMDATLRRAAGQSREQV